MANFVARVSPPACCPRWPVLRAPAFSGSSSCSRKRVYFETDVTPGNRSRVDPAVWARPGALLAGAVRRTAVPDGLLQAQGRRAILPAPPFCGRRLRRAWIPHRKQLSAGVFANRGRPLGIRGWNSVIRRLAYSSESPPENHPPDACLRCALDRRHFPASAAPTGYFLNSFSELCPWVNCARDKEAP